MTGPAGEFDFVGAKAAFLCDGRLLVYLRDDRPGLPWPAMLDLPGGGREGAESPETCLLRELEEEFGLRLPASRLIYRRVWPAGRGDGQGVFFAGRLSPDEIVAIRFGSEGQWWRMMPVAEFLAHPATIPWLVPRLQDALDQTRALTSADSAARLST